MTPILDSRGHFWWSDHLTGEIIGLPDLSVAGRLTIDESGKILLELDGILSDGLRTMLDSFNTEAIITKSIAGLLYDSDYIFLTKLRLVSSHFGSQTVSREKYQAIYCLRGDFRGARDEHLSTVRNFNIKLTGIDEWLKTPRIRNIDETAEGGTVKKVFEYKREEFQFSVANAKLSFRFDLDRDFFKDSLIGWKEVSFGQTAILRYERESLLGIEQVRELVVRLQEFFALLMGVYPDLDWPQITLKVGDADNGGTLYFLRNRPSGENPSLADLWSSFPSIRSSIGALFDAFMTTREQYGPGVYLYLACLRAESMFAENRFTTLITGLESLYRRDSSLPQESSNEKARIDRVLRDVKVESDKNWLRKKLETRAELSLQDRLSRLFEPLSQFVEMQKLKVFAEKCANLRNDVTHFGGLRGTTTYHDLLTELGTITPGLSVLYHALLLHRIGMAPTMIEDAFTSAPVSAAIRRDLARAGLLDVAMIPDRLSKTPETRN
ncbi:MAG TPA: HEPN domain-containing protein [Terracidiphilus sp.]|jgi:hypothetical protein